jgi:hypothetical protein
MTLAGLLITQALSYDDGWWTITWGVRYLLPCVPLFVMACLPWIENALHTFRSPIGIGLIVVFLLGTFIQLGAVIFNPIEYNWMMFEQNKDFSVDVIWNLSGAPLWGQWRLAGNGAKPDMTVWRLFANENTAFFILAALMLFLLALLYVFWLEMNDAQDACDFRKLAQSFILVTASLIAFVFFYSKDAYYNLRSPQIIEICNELNKRVTQSDIVFVKPYRDKAWFYFMNADCLQYGWYSLPYNIELINDIEARNLTKRLLIEKASTANRIWLVNQVWSEPDELWELLRSDGYILAESRAYPLDDSKIFLELYTK